MARVADAQETATPTRWGVRFTSGAFLPTGDARALLRNGEVSGLQISRTLSPALALTGSFGWARSRALGATEAPRLDVFTSDVGLEYRRPARAIAGSVTLAPFAGTGAGMRSYNFRSRTVDATNNLAGYFGAGGEIGMGRFGVRLEARDYIAGFKPLETRGRSVLRNDVMITAALRFDFRNNKR
ncbi:MAG: hypothetical protein IBJ03_11055 [Gemmatimonadaceae bacterium]|nr:hypothetical protein [Gemmatimonadaceae bacterium]